MFNSMSIKSKLTMSFSILGILLAVSNIVSIVSLSAIHDEFEKTNMRIIPSIQSASNIADELSSIRRFELGLLIYKLDGANDKVDRFKNEIPNRTARVDHAISNHKLTLSDSADEGRTLQDLEMHWGEYKKTMNEIQSSVLGPSGNATVQSVFGSSFDTYNQLISSAKTLIDINNKRATSNSIKASEQYTALLSFIFVIFAASFFLSIFFSLSLKKQIVKPLLLLVECSQRIASGDLSHEHFAFNGVGSDELGLLYNSTSVMRDNLRELLSEMTLSVSQLSSSAGYVKSIAERSATEMAQQQTEISMLASAINEMQSSACDVSCNANNAANAASEASRISVSGRDDIYASITNIELVASEIKNANEKTQQLTVNSKNIGVVLDVIRDIADQTNLLALNAAIEAARAGEQGRSFAVVADEVRALAQRTQSSIDEINKIIGILQSQANESGELINNSRDRMNDSVLLARKTGLTIDNINSAISTISDMSIHIAVSTEEQRSVVDDLNRTIVNINDSSNEIASGASETFNACSELLVLSTKLQLLSNKFTF